MLRSAFRTSAILAGLLFSGFAAAQTIARMELRTFDSVTLSAQQVLTGDTNGKAVTLAGELRIPTPGADRLPAVVLIHGSGGLAAPTARWAQELNSIGVATFIVDSFSGRGITNTINDQAQLANLAMMVDAFRALEALAQHPRIDPERIAVMGFSKGAVAAVYSSNERFRRLYSPNLTFAAHVGLYTPCDVRFRDDERTTGKPIRLFHGISDDYVAIEPCRAYVARLRAAGADASLTEYPDTYHAYDYFTLKQPVKFPQAQTIRHCSLAEGENGAIVNVKTGKLYDLNDPCVERGTQIAYNPTSFEATVRAVKEFFVSTFHLSPAK